MSREISTRVNNVSGRLSHLDDSEDLIFDEVRANYRSASLAKLSIDDSIKDLKNERKSIDGFFSFLGKISIREAISLLNAKNELYKSGLEARSFDDKDCKNILIDYIQNHPDAIQEYSDLFNHKLNYFLPEKNLGWFENDLRCSLFLACLLGRFILNNTYIGKDELIEAVTDRLCYKINYFNTSYSLYLPEYEYNCRKGISGISTEIIYVKSIYFKNRTKEKNIKWIDAFNSEQIEWAYNYLSNNTHPYIILEDVFFPKTNAEKYELIIASLDMLSNIIGSDIKSLRLLKTGKKNVEVFSRGCSERDDVIRRMEKAWNQFKHDSKNSKSKLALNITNKNKEKLFALAKNVNQTPNKFINKAIEDVHREIFKIDD